jgi:hypothetical protein
MMDYHSKRPRKWRRKLPMSCILKAMNWTMMLKGYMILVISKNSADLWICLYNLDLHFLLWLFYLVGGKISHAQSDRNVQSDWLLTNSLLFYSVGFGPALNSGGPTTLFFGWIVVASFVTLIGLGMAEIVSGKQFSA